jgi:hypothetical protein
VSQPGLEAPPQRRRALTEELPNAEAGEQAFDSLLTPASLRFVRCHHLVPLIGPDHEVEIGGTVVRPGRLSLAELRALPPITLSVVTECASTAARGSSRKWRASSGSPAP